MAGCLKGKVKAALTAYTGAVGISSVANEHLIRYPAAWSYA